MPADPAHPRPPTKAETPERAHDGTLVRRIARHHFGTDPTRVRRMPFGHTSRVYDVALPGRHVIARLNANPAVFRGTAHTLAELGRLGLPVPTLLASDLTREAGIVDLDAVCYGDPLYWIALTQTAVLADVGAIGRNYLDALYRGWSDAEAHRPVVALYAAVHGLDFLGRAHRAHDWAATETLLDLIQSWLGVARAAGRPTPARH